MVLLLCSWLGRLGLDARDGSSQLSFGTRRAALRLVRRRFLGALGLEGRRRHLALGDPAVTRTRPATAL